MTIDFRVDYYNNVIIIYVYNLSITDFYKKAFLQFFV